MADSSEDETPSLEQVPINSFPVAMSLLYQYLNIASRRGAFNLQESAKIMNCLQYIGSVVRPVDAPRQPSPENGDGKGAAPPPQKAAATTQPKKRA